MYHVEKIYNCTKTDTGVSMDWVEGKQKIHEHFLYPDLEIMRIHIEDLILYPERFRIDLHEHRIYVSQVGRGSY